ncbi:hypothetical protein ASPZODRAFT_153849 [Penicilliopsis zonata CBS 506.65]|uniref:D-xylose reductase [NAD(P)H] n=1 Tax=Penicilliopsis zonata CBS 506.65 TaxID=1073090 RepID=A0A1L9SB64_9EURO|nr:hypothetical protein ASPZODRAFT_153849 [Penicilliopsis zonata CBS 506.65]OJJ44412.1 hypothetical protein ASPZODRAFT_153849 [Penicilliopsis zonata CBS 506.65]
MKSQLNVNSKYKLHSGYEMPVIGYGVSSPPPRHIDRNTFSPAAIAEGVTLEALGAGYRLVDSAVSYRNERACSFAIKRSGVPRSEVFFTTKIPPNLMGYEKTLQAVETSLKETEQEYFDLILLHAPFGGREARLGSWKALIECQKAGKIRSIGVSNFNIHHLTELEEHINSGIGGKIDVAQYELHPWLARLDIVEWLQKRGVVIQANSPLASGTKVNDLLLAPLAEKYCKTGAQILIRWSLQMGFVPLPKTVTSTRIKENANVFDFEISPEDMHTLETGEYVPSTWDPTVDKS